MISLSIIKDNCWVRVEKICLDDDTIIRKFESIGIVEGQEIFVENDYPNKNTITLVINDVTYMLRRNDTKEILVNLI